MTKDARAKARRTSNVSAVAPHPIPKGMEGMPCPITGLFADEADMSTAEALAKLQADPDIQEEQVTLESISGKAGKSTMRDHQEQITALKFVPLNVAHGA